MYRLFEAFQGTFAGKRYLHRSSNLGDFIAEHLFEDLHALARSKALHERIAQGQLVVNTENLRRGVHARRGDGTLGEIIPNTEAVRDPRFQVGRGQVATVEIGAEVKILSKAMIRQVGRVITDMKNQVEEFHEGAGNPICVAIVGINRAERYTSYEEDRPWTTTGKGRHLHPCQQAEEVESRLLRYAKPKFDEFLVLRFRAENVPPYDFEWVDYRNLDLDYGAILARISREYEKRFVR